MREKYAGNWLDSRVKAVSIPIKIKIETLVFRGLSGTNDIPHADVGFSPTLSDAKYTRMAIRKEFHQRNRQLYIESLLGIFRVARGSPLHLNNRFQLLKARSEFRLRALSIRRWQNFNYKETMAEMNRNAAAAVAVTLVSLALGVPLFSSLEGSDFIR